MSKIEKLSVNGHYVWVDKEAEIKIGDWFVSIDAIDRSRLHTWKCITKAQAEIINGTDCKKIIAATSEDLEGVPAWVDYQAKEYASKRGDLDPVYANGLYYGFLEGNRAAQKELFTEDDVRKAIEFGIALEAGNIERDFKNFKTNESQFIQQLKSQKK